MSSKVELVLAAEDVVGESVIWDDRSRRLLWVDIVGRRIHRLDPISGAHEVWAAPEFVTSIGLREDGGAVVGLTQTVCRWDYDDRFPAIAMPEPDLPDNRLNEGRVGPDGAFWVGTMRNNLEPDGSPRHTDQTTGRFYRIAPDGSVTCVIQDLFGITNTIAFTKDGRLIVADTIANQIYAYPYGADHAVGADRVLFAGAFGRGLPDGSTLDAENYLWNCRVAGGACVVRFSPDGAVDRMVELPCSWPTSCTFGGPDLGMLFITSARFTMDERHLAATPLEGGLFAFRPGVRGTHERRFGSRTA